MAQSGHLVNSEFTDQTSFVLDTIAVYNQYSMECDYRRVYSYNDDNYLSSELFETLTDSSYCATTKEEYTYDKHSNLVGTSSLFYRQEWSNGEFLGLTKVVDSTEYVFNEKELLKCSELILY